MVIAAPSSQPAVAAPESGLVFYLLRVMCRAIEPMHLPAFSGSAIRGALFGAVRDVACANQAAPSCAACPLHRICGVSLLLATVDTEAPRGMEPPRPFVLRPPLDGARQVQPGEHFSFGVVLVGEEALRLLPYLVLGLRQMGGNGLGRPVAATGNGARRGRFVVGEMQAVNPFTDLRQTVMRYGDAMVTLPEAPITVGDAGDWAAARGPVQQVTLRLRTPLRLVIDGALAQRLTFEVLMRRLCRRISDLARAYGSGPPDFRTVLASAAGITVVEDRTHWLDLDSRSARQGRALPIGGLVGSITFAGELTPFLPLLALAELTGVGKDVTKGNGVIEIALPPVVPSQSPAPTGI